MDENAKPPAPTGGKKEQQDKHINQTDYNKFYEAELKKFAIKYPYLIGYMIGGVQ